MIKNLLLLLLFSYYNNFIVIFVSFCITNNMINKEIELKKI